MCVKIDGHFYCWRIKAKRVYLVHSCKNRKKKTHERVAVWRPSTS